MSVIRTPYSSVNGPFRPHLPVVFAYNNKHSPRTIGLMDSGADHTLVPYSLGMQIGFPEKSDDEVLMSVGGISGSLNYLERNCWIYILSPKKEIIGFKETVWWVYPNDEIKQSLERTLSEYVELFKLQQQSKEGTALWNHFENAKQGEIDKRIMLNNILETDVLFGRRFFNNFKFVQFFQRDRVAEDSCYFNLGLDPEKIAVTIPRNKDVPK